MAAHEDLPSEIALKNLDLYNGWAEHNNIARIILLFGSDEIYDTDGNILQALDDILFPILLDNAFVLMSKKASSSPNAHTSPNVTIVELGCGTGRNTKKLHFPSTLSPRLNITSIHALDLSPRMLTIAQKTCDASAIPISVIFHNFDALDPTRSPDVQGINHTANLVVSTLVLEHLPLAVFFKTVHNLISKSGGWLILTNMHEEMQSRARFLDPKTGQKVEGKSYVYSVRKVIEEGKKWHFHLEGDMMERGVEERDLTEGVVGVRGKKWANMGCKCWFGGLFRFDMLHEHSVNRHEE